MRAKGLEARASRGGGAGGAGLPEALFGELSFPHGATAKVEQEKGSRLLRLTDRGLRSLCLRFEADAAFVDRLRGEIEALAFPDAAPNGLKSAEPTGKTETARLEKTFAFSYGLGDTLAMARAASAVAGGPADDGWDLYAPSVEYARLGFLRKGGAATPDWRLWNDSCVGRRRPRSERSSVRRARVFDTAGPRRRRRAPGRWLVRRGRGGAASPDDRPSDGAGRGGAATPTIVRLFPRRRGDRGRTFDGASPSRSNPRRDSNPGRPVRRRAADAQVRDGRDVPDGVRGTTAERRDLARRF